MTKRSRPIQIMTPVLAEVLHKVLWNSGESIPIPTVGLPVYITWVKSNKRCTLLSCQSTLEPRVAGFELQTM